MNNITQALHWRYATKQYDTTKKISEEHINMLKESIRLTPSSFGLQPYTIVDVQNTDIREKLKLASWGKSQITDASHLFVFTTPLDITDSTVDAYIDLIAKTRNQEKESLTEYATLIKNMVVTRSVENKKTWFSKQAYIALGFLLETAALLEIDATPMEGFDNAQYDAILGLTEKGLTSTVICTLGYRSSEDTYANLEKVRVSQEHIFLTI